MRLKKRIQIFLIGFIFFILSFVVSQKLVTQFAKAATVGPQLSLFASPTSLIPNQTFDVNIGMTNVTNSITGVDAVVVFNSNVLEATGVTLGNSSLKTLAPQDATGSFDLTKAVIIDATDSAKSRLEIGLVAFDPLTQQPTAPVSSDFDPQTNPIAIIHFKTKIIGTTNVGLKFDASSVTTDSNLVTNDLGDPQDVLAGVSPDLLFTVANLPTPTPTPSVSPSPTLSATPTPTSTPSPTPVVSPTPTPIPTPSPTATPVPSATPSPSPISCTQIDFNHNSSIDIQDIMQVSYRWNTKIGDANFNSIYDLDGDGQISIVDIQKVSGRWLENCP